MKKVPSTCSCVPNFNNMPDSHGEIKTLAYVTSEGISTHSNIDGPAYVNEFVVALVERWDTLNKRVPGELEGILINWETPTEFAIYKHADYGFMLEWNRCPEKNVEVIEVTEKGDEMLVGWGFHSYLDIASWAVQQFEVHHPGMLN